MILANTTKIAVVLVEPRIPQNTGNIARLCQCTGTELFLVGDLGFRMGDKYLERAGMDYLKGIALEHLPNYETLLEKKHGWTPYFLSTKAQKTHTEATFEEKSLLVFGREDRGLPETLIKTNIDNSLRIPMVADTRSLNLSNSVSIVLYEALRQIHQF